jgi:hypothetical protein
MSSNNSNNSNNIISNNVPDDLDIVDGALSGLKKQYDELVTEIRTKHDEQQKIYQDMAQTDYEGEEYEQDRINHLIEANVANLKQQRDNIWKYLSQRYNQNTQLSYRNLKTLKNNEQQLKTNQQRKDELTQKLEDITSKNATQKKLIQHNLYKHKTVYNKTYVQFVVTVALVLCIILLYLTNVNVITTQVGFGAVAVIGLIAVLYYVYRMYIYRMNRDKYYWHKIYFSRVDPTVEVNDNNTSSESPVDYTKLDKDAKTAFAKYKTSCQSSDVQTIN